MTFQEMGLHPELIRKLQENGIVRPTEAQAQAIPHITQNRDVVVQSQTGTGKTLAYLLPILHRIDASSKELQVVVVVPTRELGMQISREAAVYGDVLGVRSQSLIGGAALGRQIEKLRLHPHLVVGTPGRILELIKMRKLSMHNVRTIVVDEVDHVFELGGAAEVEGIIRSALRSRQLLFFSATVNEAVRNLAVRAMRDPVEVEISAGSRTAETLTHLCFVCEEREKIDMLRKVVRIVEPKAAIVFVNEIDDIGELTAKLQYAGLSVEALYADAGKQERAAVLARFRESQFQLLVASDVAARGLDIKGLTHVFHFDPPIDADHYVHRAGRTGRMGQPGTVISIVTPKQLFIVRKFEKQLGIDIRLKTMYEGKIIDPGSGSKRKAAVQTARPGRRAEAPADGSAARPARTNGKPGRKTGMAAPQGRERTRDRERDRERDRKNKGAPRWLKNKPDSDG